MTNHDEARNIALAQVNELFERNKHLTGGFLHSIWVDSFTKDSPRVIESRLYVDDRVKFVGKRELYRIKKTLIDALNEPIRNLE